MKEGRRGRDTTLSIEEGGRWKQKGGMGGFLIKCQHDLNSQCGGSTWRPELQTTGSRKSYSVAHVIPHKQELFYHSTNSFDSLIFVWWRWVKVCGKRKGAGICRILLNWYLKKKLLSPSASVARNQIFVSKGVTVCLHVFPQTVCLTGFKMTLVAFEELKWIGACHSSRGCPAGPTRFSLGRRTV